MDWFHRLYEGRELFDDKVEEQAYREKQKALTHQEVGELVDFLKLAPSATILDAYCGNGRHAMALASKGYKIIGVDISISRIAFATRWAHDEGANALFFVCDTRSLCVHCQFDAVLILGGSFTHWLDEAKNVALLKGLKAVLRPGGLLLIDNPNPIRFWRIQHPSPTIDERRSLRYFDLPLGKGEAFGYVRYYCAGEMRRLLREAGLTVQGIFGTRTGKHYSHNSPRMLVIGQA